MMSVMVVVGIVITICDDNDVKEIIIVLIMAMIMGFTLEESFHRS